jgi:hypothetical protein
MAAWTQKLLESQELQLASMDPEEFESDAMLDLKTIFDPDRMAPAPIAHPALTPADLPADWHFAWDERAAIMEYDGKLPRARAEALALADILDQMRRAGVSLHNDACN